MFFSLEVLKQKKKFKHPVNCKPLENGFFPQWNSKFKCNAAVLQ
jgi:hypothetical protein